MELTLSERLRDARYLRAGHMPPVQDRGYDYVMAGNGLFKRARGRHVEVMTCLAAAHVDGHSWKRV